MKLRVLVILFVLTNMIFITGTSAQEAGPTLMPIGGGGDGIYEEFVRALVEQSTSGKIHVLILPVGYDPDLSGPVEQIQIHIESACLKVESLTQDCTASLLPLLGKNDDLEDAAIELIERENSAILLVSSNPAKAMIEIADAPLEQALGDAYQRGVLVAGMSEAGNLLSRVMINGYVEGYSIEQSFQFGAVDVWRNGNRRGLEFGLKEGIIDTHFFQRSRLGRLLNAISSPEGPHIGIGIDAYSGASIHEDGTMGHMFGLYTAGILDAQTYQAANSVQYRGEKQFISIRNLLIHLLAPSEFTFDLTTLQLSLAPPLEQIVRQQYSSEIPDGAGALILSGGLSAPLYSNPLIQRFINLSGGKNANILVIASGYSTDRAARVAAEEYQAALGDANSTILVIPRTGEPAKEISQDVSGILIIGKDLSETDIGMLPDIRSLWLQGTTIMADDAAVGLIGAYYVALDRTPDDPDEEEAYTQETLLKGRTDMQKGLGLIEALIEPRILAENRWGRLFSLVFNHPEYVGLGLNDDTWLFISPEATMIDGDNVLITLDLRNADLSEGNSGGYIIANGLMDVFAPGEILHFQDANVKNRYIHAATPLVPTSTATVTPTVTPSTTPTPTMTPSQLLQTSSTQHPTRTPRPTPSIPPPTDTNLTNAMIIVGVFAVISVFIGFWLNRRYL